MTRRKWVRRMSIAAAIMLVVGLTLLISGAIVTGRGQQPMMGVAVGMVGVFLVTGGGLFGKFAIAGPFPHNLEDV